MRKNILIIGDGAREHALAWKFKQSNLVGSIFAAPGNSGTADCGENIPLSHENISDIAQIVRKKNIDIVVVSSRELLHAGIENVLKQEGVLVFGPSQAAARLETSSAFAKDFMHRHSIPTGTYAHFTDFEGAVAFSDSHVYPLVIKSTILDQGKETCTTTIAETKPDALTAIRQTLMEAPHKGAQAELIIEDYLPGTEIRVHAFSDGSMWRLVPVMKNYRRAHDGDIGELTPGMGAAGPVSYITRDMLLDIDAKIVGPTITSMLAEGMPFVGCLTVTVMLTNDGPKVIDYGVRIGDPETETLTQLLETDLCQIMVACAEGTLRETDIHWRPLAAASLICIEGGYPNRFETGKIVSGIEDACNVPGVIVFHSGLEHTGGEYVTTGGRVLCVSSCAPTLAEAVQNLNEAAGKIAFGGMYFRTDIGKDILSVPLF